MRRWAAVLLGLCAILFAGSGTAFAQTANKVYRLGVLAPGAGPVERMQRTTFPELARLGFAEGANLAIEARLGPREQLLHRHGVNRFGFYSVASMQGTNVAYARRFCATMSDFPCIVGDEPELLAGLRRGAVWYDFDHLQGEGRALFTQWLGDHLVEQGVLP